MYSLSLLNSTACSSHSRISSCSLSSCSSSTFAVNGVSITSRQVSSFEHIGTRYCALKSSCSKFFRPTDFRVCTIRDIPRPSKHTTGVCYAIWPWDDAEDGLEPEPSKPESSNTPLISKKLLRRAKSLGQRLNPFKKRVVIELLPFEEPLAELDRRIQEVRSQVEETDVEVGARIEAIKAIQALERRADQLREDTFRRLTEDQRLQLATHPQRPSVYGLMPHIASKFMELHSENCEEVPVSGGGGGGGGLAGWPLSVGGLSQPLMAAGIGSINGQDVMLIGHERTWRANREAHLRQSMKLLREAEEFGFPVVLLVDCHRDSVEEEAERSRRSSSSSDGGGPVPQQKQQQGRDGDWGDWGSGPEQQFTIEQPQQSGGGGGATGAAQTQQQKQQGGGKGGGSEAEATVVASQQQSGGGAAAQPPSSPGVGGGGGDAGSKSSSSAVDPECLAELLKLKVPMVRVVTGAAGTLSPLPACVADRTLMLQHSLLYHLSSDSPGEGSSASSSSSSSVQLSAEQALQAGLVDQVVQEPAGGAHRDAQELYPVLQQALAKHLTLLREMNTRELLSQRKAKFSKVSRFQVGEGSRPFASKTSGNSTQSKIGEWMGKIRGSTE